MTVKEAMNIINGALDSLYEYYGSDAAEEFEEISLAEAVLEKFIKKKEEKKPEKYWAVCPDCGHELHYDTFQYDTYYEDKTYFLSSGYCPHCQKDFTWQEIFTLAKIEFDND